MIHVANTKKKVDQPGSAGTRRNIEEMRKEGGDDWLSLLNQQQTQVCHVTLPAVLKHA